MRLRIEHTTTYDYDHPISEAYTELRLKPLDADGQRCLSFRLTTDPRDEVLHYTDPFGNDVRHFDVIQPHQKLVVSAVSDVITVETYQADAAALSPVDEFNFLSPTDYAPHSPDLRQFSASNRVDGDPLAVAMTLMHAIYQGIVYEKGATDVKTTADQALVLGRGVCQDFSHIMLALCRMQGIPARYVSGYLYDDGQSAASHSWVDVLVPERGWVSLDPTHNREQTSQYVRVAVGRDYADVPPTRGIFKGNAKEKMDVDVSVKVY